MRNTFINVTLPGMRRRSVPARAVARMCRFAAGVAFLLGAVLCPSAAVAQVTPSQDSSPALAFRPGTAGEPFGWSSAIADFNADGRPDLAVADRVKGRDGSNFRIEFQLSDGRNQFVSFTSTQRALKVTAVDVDNDHDVDLVVTPVLSSDIVGVWLNDGTGHFSEVDPQTVPAELRSAQTTHAAATVADVSATELPRSKNHATAGDSTLLPVPLAEGLASTHTFVLPSRLLAFSASPRAPPAS